MNKTNCRWKMLALAGGSLFFAISVGNPALADVPVGTAVTYQGELEEAGSAVDDTCDFEFSLWKDPVSVAGADKVGSTLAQTIVVADGRFTTALDFGGDIFTGGRALWLEIAVCCPSACAVTTLSPRQELTPAPHALALPGLWTQQNAVSPNMIGGYSSNSVNAGVFGATISGGGAFANTHLVTDNFGTVGGGVDNQAGNDDADVGNAAYATVGGGQFHEASGQQSTIAGGWFNEASDHITTVGGGGGNVASARAATVGGGWLNEVAAEYGTIAGGGASNPADDATRNRVFDEYGAIGGGGNNQAGSDDADPLTDRFATVGGGDANVASGEKSTIGGGASNTASFDGATVGGGLGNTAGNFNATVAGGNSNQATGDGATVGGGAGNIAGGFRSTVSGGLSNAAGGDYSFAAGRRAKANHAGTFVWGDSTDADFTSTAADTFLIRASGGVGIGTASPTQKLSLFDGELALQVADNLNEQSILFQNSGGNYTWRLYRSNAGGSLADFHIAGGTDSANFTVLPNRLTIDTDGAVGIGTDNPAEQLDVVGNIHASGTITSGTSITIDGTNDRITASSGTIDFDNENLVTQGNVEAGGNVVVGGNVQTSQTVVNTAMPISAEQSTASTTFVQLAVFNIPDQNADRLVTMNIRFHAKGQSSGETAVFLVRGLCYGDGSTLDLADHYGSAPKLGVIHVRNSTYANYRLNLGPFALTDGQRWRFIVFYRTRNGEAPAFIDELQWEARTIGHNY